MRKVIPNLLFLSGELLDHSVEDHIDKFMELQEDVDEQDPIARVDES
jgi:hypothetical protein